MLLDLSVTASGSCGPVVLETSSALSLLSPSASIVLVSWLLSAGETKLRTDVDKFIVDCCPVHCTFVSSGCPQVYLVVIRAIS